MSVQNISGQSAIDTIHTPSFEETKLSKIKNTALSVLEKVGIVIGVTLVGALIGTGIGGILGAVAGLGYGMTAGAAYVSGAFTAHVLGFTILGGSIGALGGLFGGIATAANAQPSGQIDLQPQNLVADAFIAGAMSGTIARARHRHR